jgi:hypothetical protein
MAPFQAGDRICYRKGGPTYWVQNVYADGRLRVSKQNGTIKILTRPEDFVRIAECALSPGFPFLLHTPGEKVHARRT